MLMKKGLIRIVLPLVILTGDMLDEMSGNYYILDNDNDDDDGHLDGADVYDKDVWGVKLLLIYCYHHFIFVSQS